MPEGPTRITQPLLDVLEVLLSADDHELHGWAIMKATARSGPTIYKILERLTDADWLAWRWEAQSEEAIGPRRRFYRLTPHGVRSARDILAERRPNRIQRGFGPALEGFGA